jgi:hypothetical protein
VQDAPPSSLGGFLFRDTGVSSIHVNRLILNKRTFSPLKTLMDGSIPFKN